MFSALLIVSCNSNRVYDQFISVEEQQWHSENKMEFIVNIQDTIYKKNVFINIRNDNNYEFSSLFLIGNIEFPNGNKIIDTLEYEMTDSNGRWLGSGFTALKENKLIYKEQLLFPEKGIYKFKLWQATRSIHDLEGKNPLKGISDVGLRIENIKK